MEKSSQKYYGLIDCNNFFVSCERVFQPHLNDKPVAVLSNNDGCIVARSNEVKKLGIPMGAPAFKYRSQILQHNIHLFSSNFCLYGDLSSRVMQTIFSFTPEVQIYSIDEAFIRFTSTEFKDIPQAMSKLQKRILQWTGIPVSIGVAPTKTLAKLATSQAKKSGINQPLIISNPTEYAHLLAETPIHKIWGIGKRWALRLNKIAIFTALDLVQAPHDQIRKVCNVNVGQTQLELQGLPCLELEDAQPHKSIVYSRSFCVPITSHTRMQEAVSYYAARAALKLRERKRQAEVLSVFIQTSRFKNSTEPYHWQTSLLLDRPTNNTSELIRAAQFALKKIFRKGKEYKKAGIYLPTLLNTQEAEQLPLTKPLDPVPSDQVIALMDSINKSYGKETLCFAAQGVYKPWKMCQNKRSNRYTTQWSELCRVG